MGLTGLVTKIEGKPYEGIEIKVLMAKLLAKKGRSKTKKQIER